MSPASDKRWGFTPRPAGKRPQADTHAIERTVRIAAPVQTTWDVIADHENMAQVDRCRLRPPDRRRRTRSRWSRIRAAAEAAGRRASLNRSCPSEPPTSYRYRVTKGSPFICHLGEIRLRPAGERDRADLDDPLPAEAARNRAPAGDRPLLAARARCCARASSRTSKRSPGRPRAPITSQRRRPAPVA